MLDPRPRPGDALVAPLMTLGQRLVPTARALDLVAEAVLFQPGFTLRRRIASCCLVLPALPIAVRRTHLFIITCTQENY